MSNLEMSYDKGMSHEATCGLADHLIKPYPIFSLPRDHVPQDPYEPLARQVFPDALDLLEKITQVRPSYVAIL